MKAIGMDLGGTNLRGAVVGPDGEVLERTARPLGDPGDGEGIVKAVAGLIRDLSSGNEACAVGIGAAGPLDHRRGVMFSPPNIPGLTGMPLAERIRSATGFPTFLENDANAAVYGEYRAGAGRGCKVLLGLTLGTGVGGGIVLGGSPFRGSGGTAAEIGHMVLDPSGPPCPCGGRGHLEVLASATATASRFREGVLSGKGKLPAEFHKPLEEVESADVSLFARAGDDWSRQVLAETGRWLGVGIASLAAIFDPDAVVVMGGLAGAFEMLEPAMKASFEEQAISPSRERTRILKGTLGGDAGIIGAALLALERFDAKA